MAFSLKQLASGMFSRILLNSNFEKIEDKVNDDLLHRQNGSAQMNQDLDMNGGVILNASDVLIEGGESLSTYSETAVNAAAVATTKAAEISSSAAAAATSATNSANSATASANSATASANSATTASAASDFASDKAFEASASASSANTSYLGALQAEQEAEAAETVAITQASNAASSASSAANSASTATTQAGIATTQATNASNSATSAASSATTATTQAGIATAKAAEASTYLDDVQSNATAAAISEANAANSATASSNSASASATSATSSANSATFASTSASTATTQAGIATTQATNAASSSTSAQTSASTATTQAGIATTKASEATASAASVNANNIVHAPNSGLPNEAGTAYAYDIGQLLARDYFSKTVKNTPLFNKTGNFTVSTNQIFYAEVGGIILTIASGLAVSMPSAVVGTDYAVWLKTDGTLQATNNHITPPATNARKIGGFHYAPGGNATARAGGNTTPQINEYSFWDLKYRPTAGDPRGMTCVAGTFWADIYLLNTNPDVNGTSSYGKNIADGSSPPIIPAALGGNGSTTYGSLTWFEAMSISAVYGKSAFTQPEFMAAAYGVTDATARGSDLDTTGLDAPRTSKWGLMQATGNWWTWAQDRGGPFAGASWNANTEGFGSEYNAPNASLLGALWSDVSSAGSRSSRWSFSASHSSGSISLRCRADHLQLD
jgi:hypothetical protein